MDCRRRPGHFSDIEMRLGTARLAFERLRKDYLSRSAMQFSLFSHSASNMSSPFLF